MYNLISALSLQVYISPFQEFFSLSHEKRSINSALKQRRTAGTVV